MPRYATGGARPAGAPLLQMVGARYSAMSTPLNE